MSNTNEKSNKIRDSRFELLRIISILLIIAHHLALYGNYTNVLPYNDKILQVLTVGGKFGVNVFMIISGYFLINSKTKFSKVIKFTLQVLFFSLLGLIINILVNNPTSIPFNELHLSILPISSYLYWFITGYMMIYLLVTPINYLIKKTPKYILLGIIIFLLVATSQNYFDLQFNLGMSLLKLDEYGNVINGLYFGYPMNYIIGLFVMYVVGAYIRLHHHKIMDIQPVYIILLVISYTMMILGNTIPIESDMVFYSAFHPYCMIASISMFMIFRNIKSLKYNKYINVLSSTTLGIYLFHENLYINKLIWIKILKMNILAQTTQPILFAVLCILIIVGVFVVGAIIDIIRQYLVEKPIFKLFDIIRKFYKKFLIKIDKLTEKIKNKDKKREATSIVYIDITQKKISK